MPHGTPDWGLVGPKTTTYGLDDLGEHAVRLGSIHMWDRRGDTVILDNFEQGLSLPVQVPQGLNADVILMGGHAFAGAFCAGLTAGSDGLMRAELEYTHGLFVPSGLGIEFTFTIHANTSEWVWIITQYDGVDEWWAVVRYDIVNWVLQYEDALGAPETFATGLQARQDPRVWHTGKLVADFSIHQYVRFILNDRVWSLPGRAFWSIPAPLFFPYMAFRIYHVGTAGNPTAYCDAVVVTQNEP